MTEYVMPRGTVITLEPSSLTGDYSRKPYYAVRPIGGAVRLVRTCGTPDTTEIVVTVSADEALGIAHDLILAAKTILSERA